MALGKFLDTHGPIGPWIVTADEIPDPQQLTIQLSVNGELRQNSSTSLKGRSRINWTAMTAMTAGELA